MDQQESMEAQGDQIVVKKATHILVSAIHGPFYLSGVHLWCLLFTLFGGSVDII